MSDIQSHVGLVNGDTGAPILELLHDNGDGTFSRVIYIKGGTAGGPATIADGADVAEGATTDTAKYGDVNGSVNGRLRGLSTVTGTPTDTASSVTVLGRLINLLSRTPAALGSATSATSLPVVIASDQAAIPATQSGTWTVTESAYGATVAASANFTRPADTTAYASGDLVANNVTNTSVVAMSFTVARVAAGSGMIRRLRLRKTGTSITNASFRLHLYTAAPTPANGDNGVWSTDGAANYLGSLDVTMDKVFTDGAGGNGTPGVGNEMNFALASGQVIYGLIEARSGYAPISAEVFTAVLEVLQN